MQTKESPAKWRQTLGDPSSSEHVMARKPRGMSTWMSPEGTESRALNRIHPARDAPKRTQITEK